MSDFQGFCIAAFGTNGTGKTTRCFEFAKALKKKSIVSTILVLVPDDDEEMFEDTREIAEHQVPGLRSGIFKMIVEDPDACFERLYHDLPPYVCLLVDDAAAILDTRNPFVMKFMKRRRQKRCHVIMNCHGASDYPRSLFKNTKEFWIFQTTDSYKNIADRVQDKNHFGKAVEYVNYLARTQDPHAFLRYELKAPPRIPEIPSDI